MKIFLSTLFLSLFIPSLVLASINMTEIAWMGVSGTNGQYGEWIELYNDSDDTVDMSGWKLYSGGGSQLVFTLTKSISAKSYFLIERTTASMPDPVPGVNDESGPFGGGGLSNNGEDLVLKDSSGTVIQSLPFASGWPAGDAASKQTMQWDNTKWVTAPATPKAPFESGGSEPIPIAGGGGGENARAVKNTPRIEFSIPSNVYKGISYEFSATPIFEYTTGYNGVFKWNMGDGTYIIQKKSEPINHIYKYSGTYTIFFAYYSNQYQKEPTISGTKVLEVTIPELEISSIDDKSIQIKNLTNKIVDVSEWGVLGVSPNNITLPPMTLIAPKATIVISNNVIGIAHVTAKSLSLISPTGAQIISPSTQISKINTTVQDSVESSFLQASAIDAFIGNTDNFRAEDVIQNNPKDVQKGNQTRIIIFGGIGILVLVLAIILERFMKKNEEY